MSTLNAPSLTGSSRHSDCTHAPSALSTARTQKRVNARCAERRALRVVMTAPWRRVYSCIKQKISDHAHMLVGHEHGRMPYRREFSQDRLRTAARHGFGGLAQA